MEDKFEKIYQELYVKTSKILDEAKKEKNKNVLIVFVICLIVVLFAKIVARDSVLFYLSIIISIITIVIALTIENRKYRKLFKKHVIDELVKKCNSKLTFSSEGMISRSDYIKSKFDIAFDKFYSEDKIYGTLGNNIDFQMGQVVTKEEKVYEDEDGNKTTETVETFRGIFGAISLEKFVDADIYITANSATKKYSANRIEMDSQEFEQNYDCLTKDKITTMKIFTADLLEKFVNLRKGNLKNFQLKIKDTQIYFRCPCGEIFEPPRIKNALDREVIKKYYNIIILPIEIVEKIIENINML